MVTKGNQQSVREIIRGRQPLVKWMTSCWQPTRFSLNLENWFKQWKHKVTALSYQSRRASRQKLKNVCTTFFHPLLSRLCFIFQALSEDTPQRNLWKDEWSIVFFQPKTLGKRWRTVRGRKKTQHDCYPSAKPRKELPQNNPLRIQYS